MLCRVNYRSAAGRSLPLAGFQHHARCCLKTTGIRALTTSKLRRESIKEISTPLQEHENVRRILSLAQQVRATALKAGHMASPALPTSSQSNETTSESGIVGDEGSNAQPASRWWTRSWSDYIQSQKGVGAVSSSQQATSPPGLSQALQKRLTTPKRMTDSYSSYFLGFRSKPEVLEHYISSWGGVRVGKVLEDLDSLAGTASYKHVLGMRPSQADQEGNKIFIVTASVDRLDLLEPLRPDRDYRLTGMVVYVGKSSMEVLVTVEDITQADGTSSVKGQGRAVLTGRFTMATRNAATGQAQYIPPLLIENEAEDQLCQQGKSHKDRKQHEARVSLERVPPTSEEAQLVHQLWLDEQAHPSPEKTIHIETTKQSSLSFMHPQQRNVHFKVFGGYLMRSAYELAFMNALIFANASSVRFLALDALSFHLPVPIGSILSLTSHVAYTTSSEAVEGDIQGSDSVIASIVVLAELVDSKSGERHKSNTFHFSFDLGNISRRVLPESYRESIAFIESRRRVMLGNELRRISLSS